MIQTVLTVVFMLTCRIGYCKVWHLIGLLYFITEEQDTSNNPYHVSLTDKVCVLYFISDTCNIGIYCFWLAYVSSVYWVEGSDIWYGPSSDIFAAGTSEDFPQHLDGMKLWTLWKGRNKNSTICGCLPHCSTMTTASWCHKIRVTGNTVICSWHWYTL